MLRSDGFGVLIQNQWAYAYLICKEVVDWPEIALLFLIPKLTHVFFITFETV